MQTRSTDTPETTTEGEFTTTSSSVVDASVLRDDADTDLEKKDVGTDIEPVQATPSRGDDESINDFIDRIDSSQEYIKITPVRCEINEETIARELYGLHEYGKGQKLPLDIEKHLSLIDSAASFEFLIHKPADSTQFEFYIGPGKTGDVTCDRLQSSVRAQYPEDYSFEREQFDASNGFDEVPHMVRFNGSEKQRRDWMTRLVGLEDNDIERSPLANLLETAAQCDGEVLFQVLFEPRADWNRKASTQKMLLKRNVSSMPGLFAQSALDAIIGVSSQEKSERHRGNTPNQVGGSIHDTESSGLRPGTDRMSQIDLKDPANTYNTCIRVASTSEKTAKHITDSLNHLSGFFYRIKGKHLGRDEAEFAKMLDHELTYPRTITAWGTEKPILVTNTEELANFITVPPINHLPKASKAASGGKPASQAPITSPNEKIYQRFSDGMAIGKAVTELNDSRDDLPTSTISDIPAKNEWWDEVSRRESLHVPSDLLTIHYARLATTGSGKSVAELNDMLTAYNNFSGPVILIEPSGGDMCENYIKCHQTIYGGTDDVEYIKIPGEDGSVPGMPFFDLRPLKQAAGLAHDVAVQAKIDDYFELLNYALGKSTVEQAFVANEILTGLLKVMFDEKHGKDHFSIGEFLEVVQQYQRHGKQVTMGNDVIYNEAKAIPETSDPQQRRMLESHFDKNTQQFLDTTDAVLNRVRKLKERDFIWNMLSLDVPDENWDEDKCWYTNVSGTFSGPHDDIDEDADDGSVPLFDFIDVFGSNKVYLIDTGDIQGESSQMFSVMFLSHIWNSARSLHTPDRDDYVANILIEEAAGVARSKVVSDHILPEGRKFNLSLGLVMQYPEQVLGNDPTANQTAYNEILNNINTKIIGNISADDKLAESLFHDDLNSDEIKNVISGLEKGTWLVELPGSGFGEDKQKPEVLTVEALPVPPGHDASGIEAPATGDRVRRQSQAKYCISGDHRSVRRDGFTYYTGDQPDKDEQRENLGEDNETVEITKDEQRFLEHVANALSDGHGVYTLGTSMNELEYSHAADALVEKGLLDDHKMGNRQVYYSVTEKGADIDDVDPQPANGGEKGSESFEHRFGVRIMATWLEQQGYDVEMYHTFDGDNDDDKFDVYAVDTKDSPDTHRKVVEVETCPDKRGHVKGDYEKLAAEYGDAIWVVETFDDGIELVQKMIDIGKLDDSIDTSVRRFEDLNDQLDEDGISKVVGMTDLMDKV